MSLQKCVQIRKCVQPVINWQASYSCRDIDSRNALASAPEKMVLKMMRSHAHIAQHEYVQVSAYLDIGLHRGLVLCESLHRLDIVCTESMNLHSVQVWTESISLQTQANEVVLVRNAAGCVCISEGVTAQKSGASYFIVFIVALWCCNERRTQGHRVDWTDEDG